jgi:hypothetical protein
VEDLPVEPALPKTLHPHYTVTHTTHPPFDINDITTSFEAEPREEGTAADAASSSKMSYTIKLRERIEQQFNEQRIRAVAGSPHSGASS